MRGKIVFAGTQGRSLAERVCKKLSIDLGKALVGRFNDGEVRIEIQEDVRDADVFIINPTNPPLENLYELILLAEAAKMASARTVTVIPTYLGYNRQDRKDKSRVPISARLPIKAIEDSGADRVLLFDVHSEATLIAFSPRIKVDHLYASLVAAPRLIKLLGQDPFVVASPDRGGGPRAAKYAALLGQDDYVIFDKSRPKPGEVSADVKVIGDVKDKDVLFIDDMIDTGGTIIADAKAAKAAGARHVYAFATHGLFSKDALTMLYKSDIDRIMVTDTVYQEPKRLIDNMQGKIEVISIEELLGKAINNLFESKSLSALIPVRGTFAHLIAPPRGLSGMKALIENATKDSSSPLSLVEPPKRLTGKGKNE
jgi:ribose-phosphate pyrophosphokinase